MKRRYTIEAQIQMSGGDRITEITDLLAWLRGERALAGTVRAMQRPPDDGELGGVFDMLAMAPGSGGAAAALARSPTAWLGSRRADVTVTVTSPSGSVTLDARRVDDRSVLPLLREVLRDHDEH